jgi:hypothetical protein
MIMRGTTPRTLTWGGGLALLGLGALLLPLMPTWAQTPAFPGQPPGGGGFGGRESREKLDAMDQELKRMQMELERMQMELRARAQELQQKMEQFNRFVEARKDQAKLPPQAGPNNPFGGPGAGGGGRGGVGAGGPAGMPGAGNAGRSSLADVEKRLQQVEKKIDMLIQLMHRPGPQPGFAPSVNPAGAPAAGFFDNVPGTKVPEGATPSPTRSSGSNRQGGGGTAAPTAPATVPADPAAGPAPIARP